jgi:hypothetical protein
MHISFLVDETENQEQLATLAQSWVMADASTTFHYLMPATTVDSKSQYEILADQRLEKALAVNAIENGSVAMAHKHEGVPNHKKCNPNNDPNFVCTGACKLAKKQLPLEGDSLRIITHYPKEDEVQAISRASMYTDVIVMSIEAFRRNWTNMPEALRPRIQCPIYIPVGLNAIQITLLFDSPATVRSLLDLRTTIKAKSQLVVISLVNEEIPNAFGADSNKDLVTYIQAHEPHPGHLLVNTKQLQELKRIVDDGSLVAGHFHPDSDCYPLLYELVQDEHPAFDISFFLTLS